MGRRVEDAMPHDKIKAAARKRMAETGEPAGLMELRPGAPLRSRHGIRGHAAADTRRQAPEAAAHTYADTRSFLAEFYPGDVGAEGSHMPQL